MAGPSKDKGTLEGLIIKATDETLTADNWQFILDVCDKISSEPENGTKEAIKVLTVRLNVKDANVTLRALSLLVAMAENCGSRMQQEIASVNFLQGCLFKRLADKRLHVTVKYRVAEVIKQLHESFKADPSLRPMTDAYNRLTSEYPQYLKASAPDKPEKKSMSKQDKIKEDEELQRVLKLSLHEYEREQSIKRDYLNNKELPLTGSPAEDLNNFSNQAKNQSIMTQNSNAVSNDAKEKTIANVSKVRALYDLISYEPDELSFRKGDIITVIESVYRDWWRGSLANGKVGIFPLNYVTPVVTKSPKELEKELEEENRILNELKKVNKLMAMLSTNPEIANEDEVSQLYNDIISIRPALGKFIDKYSVRKEEFLALNQHLNEEVKFYNELMDKLISMKAYQQPMSSQMAPYPTNSASVSQNYSNGTTMYPSDKSHLNPQHTSAGFGNAYNMPYVAPQFLGDLSLGQMATQDHRQQVQYPQYPSKEQFLNIQRFPDVNNL